jgi:hypothetical protein
MIHNETILRGICITSGSGDIKFFEFIDRVINSGTPHLFQKVAVPGVCVV